MSWFLRPSCPRYLRWAIEYVIWDQKPTQLSSSYPITGKIGLTRSHDQNSQPTRTLGVDESSLCKHSSCSFIRTIVAGCDPGFRSEGVLAVRRNRSESCFPIAHVDVQYGTGGIWGDFQAEINHRECRERGVNGKKWADYGRKCCGIRMRVGHGRSLAVEHATGVTDSVGESVSDQRSRESTRSRNYVSRPATGSET